MHMELWCYCDYTFIGLGLRRSGRSESKQGVRSRLRGPASNDFKFTLRHQPEASVVRSHS